jgi:hypothetical protein
MLTQHTIAPPQSSEYAPYYAKYIALAPKGDLLEILEAQLDDVMQTLRSISESQAEIVHPPYAWTIRQAVGHLTDSERIFAYRALRISRGDQTPLPGFDENTYAKTGGFNDLTLREMADDFECARRSTISLFRLMPAGAWTNTGTANGYPVSARALPWIIVGHAQHHLAIIRQRLGM